MNNDTLPTALTGCQVLPPLTTEAPAAEKSKSSKGSKRKYTADRFNTLNKLVDYNMDELCAGDLKVWLILYRDTRDGSARTGQTDIARRAGMSPRGVRIAIKRLIDKGLLELIDQGGLNKGLNRYKVLSHSP